MGSLPNRTAHRKGLFLKEFGDSGIISRAAEAAGVGRTTVYEWQEHDEQFAYEFRQAELRATEVLETEARRRAVEGVVTETPVRSRTGELLDTIVETKYSDTLLIFLLKARAPEKYRDRYDVTTGGQPFQPAIVDLDAAIARRLADLAVGSEGPAPLALTGSAKPTDP